MYLHQLPCIKLNKALSHDRAFVLMIQKFFSGLLLMLMVFACTYVGLHLVFALVTWTNPMVVLSSLDYIPGHVLGTIAGLIASIGCLCETAQAGEL